MRRWLTALVILFALVLALSRLSEVGQVLETLQRGNWLWLGLAALAQLVWLINSALVYREIYQLLAMAGSLTQLLPLAATSNFINTVAPSAGMGGMAIFVNDGLRRRLPAARVTIAAFSIGYLFQIVSPTPGGIGVVEGALALALRSLGVPLAAATILTLAYRGITFWLPLAYGFAAMRILQRQWRREKAGQAMP